LAAFRIFIADDHEVVRKGLCSLLQAQPDWEVCGEAADGREAVEKAQQLKPDVVILDIGMPSLNGLEATRQILRGNPLQRVLILTVTDAEQLIEEVLKAGARGFVLKADAAKDLTMAVDALQLRDQQTDAGDAFGNLEAEQLRQRIVKGEDFAKVAKEESDDKRSGEQGTWMATVGIVLGVIHVALIALIVLVLVGAVFFLGSLALFHH